MKLKAEDLRDGKKALTHLLLQSAEVAHAVAKTPGWSAPENIDDKEVHVTVQFNGVSVEAELLEKLLAKWYEGIQKSFEKQYSDVESEVSRRVEKKVLELAKEKIDPITDQMQELMNQMHNMPHLIVDSIGE